MLMNLAGDPSRQGPGGNDTGHRDSNLIIPVRSQNDGAQRGTQQQPKSTGLGFEMEDVEAMELDFLNNAEAAGGMDNGGAGATRQTGKF